jgi:anti-sigma28 factor (negative regulator of flagellin synthesis)
MRIQGNSYEQLRSIIAPTTSAPDTSRPASSDEEAADVGRSRSDSVQFSDAARTMASQMTAQTDAAMDPARIAELRTKVLNGAYNSLDMVEQVARRIAESGDL